MTEIRRSEDAVRALLALWGESAREIRLIDSSHGEDDIRENYVIDRRLVLRVNSAPVLDDAALADLNRLIGRYRDFGIAAPRFLPLDGKDCYITHTPEGFTAYLSEYLDLTPADQLGLDTPQYRTLDEKILRMTAEFAARYKNVDLSAVYGMYSLFDLCPYDKANGYDEKQENCDLLCDALREAGEPRLAEGLEQLNAALRARLLRLYPRLPKCVFQGDENGSNLCLNGRGEIIGIFDFNMAGTDVCVNYLANHALYLYDTDSETLKALSPEQLFAGLRTAAKEGRRIVDAHYPMSPEEQEAYPLYLAITALFQWPVMCDYRKGLQDPAARENVLGLLRRVMEEAGRLL